MTNKDRLSILPQAMPEQDPQTRAHNMSEVALGYTAEQAKREASRCLNCPAKPCMQGCPVAVDIPGFLAKAAEGRFDEALAIIQKTSLLPAVCGRVCPQEKQCQKFCTVGKILKDVAKSVAIGRVERFVADQKAADDGCSGRKEVNLHSTPTPTPTTTTTTTPTTTTTTTTTNYNSSTTRRRIAVIGSGPASITCAADCARAGFDVTLFEAFHKCGGVLVYGIPEFRLPKAIVAREIDNLRALGVTIETNVCIGRTISLASLLKYPNPDNGNNSIEEPINRKIENSFDAVFVGTGAGLPKFMGIPGENLNGVFSANEYLTRANLMKAYDEEHSDTPYWHGKRTAVLGGGNVAMDAARMALRLGAEKVHLIYRRSLAEMPARLEEIHHAEEEGVEFRMLQNAKRILGDESGKVCGLECLRYELGEPDASGRRSPVVIPGSEFTLDVDTVIVAVGNASNPLIPATTEGLAVNKRGNIIVDPETNMTSIPGVFAGGDIVLGAATVILAMGEGRRAAAGIRAYVTRRTS